MKSTGVLLFLVLGVALGYLLGTESGRQQKEVLLVKLGRGPGDAEETASEETTTEDAVPAGATTE